MSGMGGRKASRVWRALQALVSRCMKAAGCIPSLTLHLSQQYSGMSKLHAPTTCMRYAMCFAQVRACTVHVAADHMPTTGEIRLSC